MGHYETLITQNLGMDSDLYLALKAKLMHKKSTEEVTIIGIPPITIISNGDNATVGLKGNEEHTGTPSPTSPVMPQGTGERTAQLFDKNTVVVGERILANSVTSDSGYAHTDYIECEGYNYITVNKAHSANTTNIYFYADKTNTSISYYKGQTAEVPVNAKYVRINMDATDVNTFMVNSGETPLPYESYGYKLAISSANTTTPVYLGEVQTTRRVKKLVLTGEENWERQSGQSVDYFRISNMNALPSKVFCTHYTSPDDNIGYANIVTGIKMQQSSTYGVILACRPPNITGLADFKSFLAAQYANGTPATVWYVLANEEIGIVNEPLYKIGDYTDEISGIIIPTVKGTNIVDVDTEVKPSEISITYTKGKEININNISDMENLTIADLEKMTIAELEG